MYLFERQLQRIRNMDMGKDREREKSSNNWFLPHMASSSKAEPDRARASISTDISLIGSEFQVVQSSSAAPLDAVAGTWMGDEVAVYQS